MVSAPAVRIDARVPQQSRSRKRRENILSAANALIAQHGILGLRMNDVAKLAQVPIGSVYQYSQQRASWWRACFPGNWTSITDWEGATCGKCGGGKM